MKKNWSNVDDHKYGGKRLDHSSESLTFIYKGTYPGYQNNFEEKSLFAPLRWFFAFKNVLKT